MTYQPPLAGKTIIVTGAASGIGAESAAEIKRQGGKVLAVDLNEPAANADEFFRADLSSPAEIDALAAQMPAGANGLCNIAGLPPSRPPELVVKVNLMGLKRLTCARVPRLADNAAIVNLASLAGVEWPDNTDVAKEGNALEDFGAVEAFCKKHNIEGGRSYFFTKEALIIWTMQNRWTWRDRGIRMNSVSPGPVDTPIFPEFLATLGERAEEDMKIMDRVGLPKDVAPVVAFLLGDGSAWIRGTNIATDGGMFSHIQCARNGLL